MSDTRTNEHIEDRVLNAVMYIPVWALIMLSDSRMAVQSTGQFPQLNTKPQKPKKTGKKGKRG